MNIDEAIKIFERVAKKNGYEIKHKYSHTTNSIYFTIYSGEFFLRFRLADHKNGFGKDIITFRFDRKATQKTIEGFIENRCKDLRDRKMKSLLGINIIGV